MIKKEKLLNLGLIITSFTGYLEWGTDNQMILLTGEVEIILKLIKDPLSVVHPFTLIPLLGQILLIITLFQQQPSRMLTFTGLGCLALLLAFIFVIGLISANYKIAVSAIPFLLMGYWVLSYDHRQRKQG